jgi:hypothetical protein
MSVYDQPPVSANQVGNSNAPSAADVQLANANVAHVPWDLKGFSSDRLNALGGAALSSLCQLRGLAQSGSIADKTMRLLKWKKEQKPKGPKPKRPRDDPPSNTPPTTAIVAPTPTAAPAGNNTVVNVNVQLYHPGLPPPTTRVAETDEPRKRHREEEEEEEEEKSKGRKDTQKMSQGKHEGKTFIEIYTSDANYVQWIVGQAVMNNADMNDFQGKFLL